MPDERRHFTDNTATQASTAKLAATFTHFAENRCGAYAPLYARLGAGIADDPELLDIAAAAAPGQSPPDLMLAAVHYLLTHANTASPVSERLARYYPSLAAVPVAGDPFPDFRRFCREHRDELVELVATRWVQTNEVRRCCYLLPAVLLAGRLADRPLALIEPGASAGLNLALDAYTYEYAHDDGAPATLGDEGSRLLLRCHLHGQRQPPFALPIPRIAWRAGIDLNPLNPGDPHDVAWLRALVWPDHHDRRLRLDEALRIAAARPPVPMFAGDVLEQLPAAVDAAPADAAVCVFHTAFLAHVARDERDRFTRQIQSLSTRRTIYWIQAEPPHPHRDPAEPRLRLTMCDRGEISGEWPLAHYQPHGAWLEWLTSAPARI